VLWWW